MSVHAVPGLYGKLPILGDFVSRRLPADFVRTWDMWIQEALAASREQLDTEWLEAYLTSPIWRFILSPGNCGEMASAGILMPSVDKVGRYFPLTLAAIIDDQEALPYLFVTAADWFDTMERLALSALEDNVEMDDFDRELQGQCLPLSVSPKKCLDTDKGLGGIFGETVIRFEMEGLEKITEAFYALGTDLLNRFFPGYSLWSTTGSELVKPSLLIYKGLPPAAAFSDFLIGNWQKHRVNTANVALPARTPPNPPKAENSVRFAESKERVSIKWRSRGRTNVGRVRDLNEDAYLENPENGVWVVADGMGGHLAGDEASKAIVEALQSLSGADTLEALTAEATTCLQKTNTELIRRAQEKKLGQIMGSTVVVMLAVGEQCAAIWAGDSRLYRYRGGLLSQLTCDHSPAPDTVNQGLPPFEGVAGRAQSNVVTKALGAEPDISVDIVTFEANQGDTYLLCSDGLTKEVRTREVAEILSQSGCNESSRALIDLALARGARDNVTVIVVTADRDLTAG